jgi:hypothetical protein
MVEPGNHPQAGRFARSRGSQQGKKLAIDNTQADIVHSPDLAKMATHITKLNRRGAVPVCHLISHHHIC